MHKTFSGTFQIRERVDHSLGYEIERLEFISDFLGKEPLVQSQKRQFVPLRSYLGFECYHKGAERFG